MEIATAIVFVIGVPAMIVSSSSQRKALSEEADKHPWIWYYFAGLLVLWGILYLIERHAFKIKETGSLALEEDHVSLKVKGKEWTLKYTDFKKIIVIRNTTYHLEESQYQKKELFGGNNWIELYDDENKLVYKYEFLIESSEHNQSFEKCIFPLRKKLYPRLIYKSI